jgi:hypothetical protein
VHNPALLSMSVVAFTFGSFGDILATASLVTTICRVLDNPSDPSLTEELRLLHQLLLLTHDVVQRQRSSRLTGSLVHLVEETVSRCHSEMRSFLQKIEDIQKRSLWSKVFWAAQQQDDVIKLKGRLSAHRQTLSCLLAALNKSVSACFLSS